MAKSSQNSHLPLKCITRKKYTRKYTGVNRLGEGIKGPARKWMFDRSGGCLRIRSL